MTGLSEEDEQKRVKQIIEKNKNIQEVINEELIRTKKWINDKQDYCNGLIHELTYSNNLDRIHPYRNPNIISEELTAKLSKLKDFKNMNKYYDAKIEMEGLALEIEKESYETYEKIINRLPKKLNFSNAAKYVEPLRDIAHLQEEKNLWAQHKTFAIINLITGNRNKAWRSLMTLGNYRVAGELAEELGDFQDALNAYDGVLNDEELICYKGKIAAKYKQRGEDEKAIEIINSVDSLEERMSLAENNEYYEVAMNILEKQQNYEQAAIMAKKAGLEKRAGIYRGLVDLEKEKENLRIKEKNLYKTLEK